MSQPIRVWDQLQMREGLLAPTEPGEEFVVSRTGPGRGVDTEQGYKLYVGNERKGMGNSTHEKHAFLKSQIRRAKGGRVATGGISPINFRADHGTQQFFDQHFPLFEARGIPVTLGMITEGVGATNHRYEPLSYTWPQLRDLHHRGVSIWCHQRSHEDPTDTAELEGRPLEEVMWREVVLCKIEMLQNGIIPVGTHTAGITPCKTPDFGSNIYLPEFWESIPGKWVLENFGICELAAFSKNILGEFYTTGGKYRYLPTHGENDLGHFTLDGMTVAQVNTAIDNAIAWGCGLQMMWHPLYVSTAANGFSTANLEEVLDYVVTLRDQGKLMPLTAEGLAFADMDATRRVSIFADQYFERGIVPGQPGTMWGRSGNTAVPLTIAQDGTTGRYIVSQPGTAGGYIYQSNGNVADHLWWGHSFSAEVECRNTGQTIASQMRISVYADNVLLPGVNRLQNIAADSQWKTVRQVFCIPKGTSNIHVRIDRPIGDGAIEYRRFGVHPI